MACLNTILLVHVFPSDSRLPPFIISCIPHMIDPNTDISEGGLITLILMITETLLVFNPE